MSLKIISIGFNFCLDDVTDLSILATPALADADIIFFTPSLGEHYWEQERFASGEAYMDVEAGARLRATIQHWRTEITYAVNAGKTVIALMDRPQTFKVETGRTYSGTGRSRAANISTSTIASAGALPVGFTSITAGQSAALAVSKESQWFTSLWRGVAQYFEAQAYFVAPEGKTLLELADGSKRAVGAVFGKNRNLFILPDIKLLDEHTDDEQEWTEHGRQLIESIKALGISLHKHARSESQEVEPDWAKSTDLKFKAEIEAEKRISALRAQQAALDEQVKEMENATHPIRELRALLFGSGPRLESAVRAAFELLGFTVGSYKDEEREIDLVLEFGGKRFVGEIEGKEAKPIDVNKLSQLERILVEDYERPEVSEHATGILMGNAFRIEPPSSRGDGFTTKVLQAAERRGIILVETRDLFDVCMTVLNGDDEWRQTARDRILSAAGGIVRFR